MAISYSTQGGSWRGGVGEVLCYIARFFNGVRSSVTTAV